MIGMTAAVRLRQDADMVPVVPIRSKAYARIIENPTSKRPERGMHPFQQEPVDEYRGHTLQSR